MPASPSKNSSGLVLVFAVFIIAICGLVYELIAGTVASYLIGNSVTQFSLVIGIFMSAMGLGSFLSKFIKGPLLVFLIIVEMLAGILGGLLAPISFAAFVYTQSFTLVMLGGIFILGVLVGLEIPLVIRILKQFSKLRLTLAHVLSADYTGALAASLLFPFFLMPALGFMRAGLLMGMTNVAVAGVLVLRFRKEIKRFLKVLSGFVLGALFFLIVVFMLSDNYSSFMEEQMYQDNVIFSRDSQYQHLIITRWKEDLRFFLNGHLQFSSIDEYRYHEALVHPAMSFAERREQVLILGGGDGLALREVLKYDQLAHVDLVDLDPMVTQIFKDNPLLTKLNQHSLSSPKCQVYNQDAMTFLADSSKLYDVILIDLPDPSVPDLAKLYSRSFYRLCARHLAAGGVLVSQSTSPFRSREAFWCIAKTMESTQWGPQRQYSLNVLPYHTLVPSFGTWGFCLASREKLKPEGFTLGIKDCRYLTEKIFRASVEFPPDMGPLPVEINLLNSPRITDYYTRGYHKYLD